jgi:nucleotide-binding universal stress UspA family protein
MDFKDILVHMDNSRQCEARLELAIALAREHHAHLTGLYVITHPHYAPQGEVLDQRLRLAREMFRARTGGAGIDAEYRCIDPGVSGDRMVEVLNHYAHRKDLIVVGQALHDKHREEAPADLPDRVVLGSGRPVLVVPYAGRFSSAGERVVVAWKAGRASARALHDAMPFLIRAKQVYVVTLRSSDDRQPADTQGDDAIATHLQRHGIRVTEETLETGEAPVANLLMNHAWERGCDLMVMGVYAQGSRGTQTVGPVARTFLEHMTLPVLMSN